MAVRHNLTITFVFSLLSVVLGQESAWLTPDGSQPNYTTAFSNADLVTVSWNAMTGGPSDLWISAVDSNYATRLGSNIDITRAGTYPWTITVGDEEIDIDDRFLLAFIPTGTSYKKEASTQYDTSPAFILVKQGEPLPSNTSATSTSSTPSSTSSPTSDSTSESSAIPTEDSSDPSDDSSSSLSGGLIAAIAIGVLLAVVLILGLLLWGLKLRRKVKAANNIRSSGIIPVSGVIPVRPGGGNEKRISGVHETNGDQVQPVELPARRKTVYHEMSG
ncbi:uncharacterized protein HMPREF1541_02309 [Cyphellophora europaea CBS 101466]|uniref:Mid2 domain-containing protein n=1 Tax=Cyphellophora europaea (strain CBS 101466) TaxID=1220924 RepID=W2S358_CYPE1|nr:uncharacterized protein HMPREF1541_02309 [Cyphellophora europaea CBS 101466]ETN43151.1 hypothetical protein HMPREF1541_02309 [Cyphellophora europaea CBS 101466]